MSPAPFVTDWKVVRQLGRQLPRQVGTSARLLYLLLAGHLRPDGTCWPSIPTLAREMGCHEDTARRARAELERAGLIVVIPGGGNRPNLYRLLDFRLSTPPAPVRGVTPRARADDPPRTRRRPPAPTRAEVVEEVMEENAREAAAFVDAASARVWRRQYT
jgi:DNA-binding transcriptional MocR family regulator